MDGDGETVVSGALGWDEDEKISWGWGGNGADFH